MDLVLHLIGKDCQVATPSCKGGWEITLELARCCLTGVLLARRKGEWILGRQPAKFPAASLRGEGV